MTFQDFQQLCNNAIATNHPVQSPCPIIVGDPAESVKASYGDSLDHPLILFTEKPNTAALRPIVQSVRFIFDAPNNQTVIQPLTTGT